MKPLITLAFLLCLAVQTYATHLRGGYISVRHIIGLTYEISVYLESADIYVPPDRDTIQVSCGDGNTINLLRVNGPLGTSGVPMGDSTYNYSKLNIYRGEYTYAANGDYIISYTDPNRVAGIINCSSSVNTPLYIETLLRAFDYCFNSTVTFNSIPHIISFTNEKLNISFNAYDANRDSLSYEIISALRAHNTGLGGWINPADIGGMPGTIFSIDNKSGMLTWDKPVQVGLYAFAIKVSEWKNGCFYGYTIRDVSIIIDTKAVDFGNFSGLDNIDTNALGEPEIHINEGDTLRMNFAFVNTSSFLPEIVVEGEPFENNHTATYSTSTVTSAGNDSVLVSIEWATNPNYYVTTQPFYITLRGTSQTNLSVSTVKFFNDVTIPVYIHGSVPNINCYCPPAMTSVEERQQEIEYSIYPNPTTGLLHITATESEIEKITVHNITGKEVSATYSTVIDLNTQPDGVYFITIVTNKGVATKKVMVAR